MIKFSLGERRMRLRNVWVHALGVTLSVSLTACGGGQESSAPATTAAPPAGATKVDPSTAGDIKGTITLTGAAPKNEPIRMNADPICVKQTQAQGAQSQETFLVSGDGKLGN